MATGARTPEELETLLEDARLAGDLETLAELFETGALACIDGAEVRGAQIAERVAGRPYVALPARVLMVRDTALIVAERAISVVRRRDGEWRYAISLHTNHHEGTHT